jgi:putative transposase
MPNDLGRYPPLLISARHHQPRGLALLPLHPELPRRRRPPRAPRHHRLVRIHSALVRDLRPRVRSGGSGIGRAGRRQVGTPRDDSWPASVPRAGRRQDGEVIDILLQSRRDRYAAARFFRKLLKRSGRVPHRLRHRSPRELPSRAPMIIPSVAHDTTRYANNRAEVSHQPTRRRESHMRRFKSTAQAQRFLAVHDVVRNLFNVGRHRLGAPSATSAFARVHHVERRSGGLTPSTPRPRPQCAALGVNLTVPGEVPSHDQTRKSRRWKRESETICGLLLCEQRRRRIDGWRLTKEELRNTAELRGSVTGLSSGLCGAF